MLDFGHAEVLEPEAIGEPGQRAFRLRIMSGSDSASLWLEKEQLAALTLAFRHLLEQTEERPSDEAPPPPSDQAFPEPAQVDMKLGRLGIGYDEDLRMVTIFAYATDEAEDAPPTFACQVNLKQCVTFAQRAEETINAGRPVCVLCGMPIEKEGHKCHRRNGHSSQPISLEEAE
jgi:uncharacterized repeat protein (TIGR03847 family)